MIIFERVDDFLPCATIFPTTPDVTFNQGLRLCVIFGRLISTIFYTLAYGVFRQINEAYELDDAKRTLDFKQIYVELPADFLKFGKILTEGNFFSRLEISFN